MTTRREHGTEAIYAVAEAAEKALTFRDEMTLAERVWLRGVQHAAIAMGKSR